MLRVTVEIVPFGNEAEAHVIERMLITNVDTSSNNIADYEYVKTNKGNTYSGSYNGFPRKYGAWELICQILDEDSAFEYSLKDIGQLTLTRGNMAQRLFEYRVNDNWEKK
jgi:sorbitol-specific phosphotransferase system component IIA